MKNWKVELEGNAPLVIAGEALSAASEEGQRNEAIAAYNRRMGIISTNLQHKAAPSEEAPTSLPVVPRSDPSQTVEAREAAMLDRLAEKLGQQLVKGLQAAGAIPQNLGEQIARGLAEAMPAVVVALKGGSQEITVDAPAAEKGKAKFTRGEG